MNVLRSASSIGKCGLLALTLTACSADFGDLFDPVRVSAHDKVGTVNLAVTMVAPWAKVKESLKPDTEHIDYKEALKMALPVTSQAIEKDSRATGINIAGSYINHLPVGTDGQPAKPEDPQSTEETAKQTKDRPKAADLPGQTIDGSKNLGNDPLLHLNTATAVFQEAKLQNLLPDYAAIGSGQHAYLVRFQLSVIPYRRNMPYDIMTTLSFVPRECPKGDTCTYARKLRVLPLLVTDNLEGTHSSRSRNDLRQVTTALTALLPTFALNASLSDVRELLQSIYTNDLNGLLTIGQITENSFMVRLGAPRQSTAGYATIPRTHNITVLLIADEQPEEQPIKLVARTEYFDALKDSKLSPRNRSAEIADIASEIAAYAPSCRPDAVKSASDKDAPFDECWDFEPPLRAYEKDFIQERLIEVILNETAEFGDDFVTQSPFKSSFKHDLWTIVVNGLSRNGVTATDFEINDPKKSPVPATLPPPQSPTLVDDGTNVTIEMYGGDNLSTKNLAALVTLVQDNASSSLPATNVELASGTSAPKIALRTLSKTDLKKIDWTRSYLQLDTSGAMPDKCISKLAAINGKKLIVSRCYKGLGYLPPAKNKNQASTQGSPGECTVALKCAERKS